MKPGQDSTILAVNEYMILPGFGFDMHPQPNLECIYMVCEGALSHEDSLGNKTVLAEGCAQRIVAGSGYARKFYNHSRAPARLIMVLLHPEIAGDTPIHEIKRFEPAFWANTFCLIASGLEPGGCAHDASFLHVASRARVLRASVKNTSALIKTGKEKVSLVYVIDGEMAVNGALVSGGAYALIHNEDAITVDSQKRGECLLVQSVSA